ncbi:MAG: histidine phosphatase family protein [Gammaproteobacteria bacterium]|nr:histidine phosphatase family protein [Gammaproteobacteria bacterium]
MRHATAEDPARARDFERALTPGGCDDARAMGRWLRQRSLSITQVLCSPALRTRQTAELVLDCWADAPQVEVTAGLYLADWPALVATLEPIRRGALLLIGHNPGLEDLLTYMLPRRTIAQIAGPLLPPGALYVVHFTVEDGVLVEGSGQLRTAMRPQLLSAE